MALAVMVVVQAVVLRLRRGEQFFGSVVVGFVVGLLVVLALQAVLLTSYQVWVRSFRGSKNVFVRNSSDSITNVVTTPRTRRDSKA